MAGMNNVLFKLMADVAAQTITHVGLVDVDGVELSGAPYYRVEVTWDVLEDGTMTPVSDLTFGVPGSGDELNPTEVAGFRLFDQDTGGINYGGKDIQIKQYITDGEYTLPQDKIFIHFHNADIALV
jgi:hypothetical protein